jgi:hypothetical protein
MPNQVLLSRSPEHTNTAPTKRPHASVQYAKPSDWVCSLPNQVMGCAAAAANIGLAAAVIWDCNHHDRKSIVCMKAIIAPARQSRRAAAAPRRRWCGRGPWTRPLYTQPSHAEIPNMEFDSIVCSTQSLCGSELSSHLPAKAVEQLRRPDVGGVAVARVFGLAPAVHLTPLHQRAGVHRPGGGKDEKMVRR